MTGAGPLESKLSAEENEVFLCDLNLLYGADNGNYTGILWNLSYDCVSIYRRLIRHETY